ncbi:MAG TPA: RHS repeat-associated core domain-containing protein [Dokdonella sp.]|uniref:RHS repeat-associated core domain-containing protein n=1 Tax=Dokdonella sp. TaxID=2291710 RepID=UPI002BE158A0|nr:RHS repeat-associated core domain-containing protein [Dokdonella sp.]HUD43043.1 RHS repeat-associated core domain-containing protein [Dokdonella sp.]
MLIEQARIALCGHYTDFATGLSYMQQRYYDPYAGRFLAVDPVAASPGSFNRYWYANNNPYKFVDPDGQASKVAYLVRLTATGMRKVAALSQEQAVLARRSGENVLGARRQISSQIERAAFPNGDRMKHAAHELEDGAKGLPHYQTEGQIGHSFWGRLGGAALAASTFLDNLADAAEYLPDAAPRPATGDDIDRTNGVINFMNEKTGSDIPNFSKRGIGEFKGVFRVGGRVDESRLNEEMKRK